MPVNSIYHPENWVMNRLDICEPHAILDAVSMVIARVLNVSPKTIPKEKARKYLYAISKEKCHDSD